jgi:3-deoxy-D-manno-octulosonic-acid transferase
MYLLYSFLLTLAAVAFLPYFAYQAFVNRKYLSNFRERLGRLPESLSAGAEDRRPAIWLHAVSVGETLAARPLVKALRERFPNHRLIVSTTTATGQQVARSRLEADGFCYFPFDWRFSVRRALRCVRPQVVVLMESELWPNFLGECRRRGVPVVVANGRVSDRSVARAERFDFLLGPLRRRMLADVTHFSMQSAADAERMQSLGAPAERVSVSGNIKYDIGTAAENSPLHDLAAQLNAAFALDRQPLIIAGSTADGEEELVIAAFEKLRRGAGGERVRLLIAPRHPERFDAVARLLDSSRLRYVRRSAFAALGAAQPELASAGAAAAHAVGASARDKAAQSADVILLDSMGELAALYAKAAVVFVGGSLMPKGGHNILEPAAAARPVVVGPHMENFREITAEFLRRDAVVQIGGAGDAEMAEALYQAFAELLGDAARARTLGENARRAVADNRGATAHTAEVIEEVLGVRC